MALPALGRAFLPPRCGGAGARGSALPASGPRAAFVHWPVFPGLASGDLGLGGSAHLVKCWTSLGKPPPLWAPFCHWRNQAPQAPTCRPARSPGAFPSEAAPHPPRGLTPTPQCLPSSAPSLPLPTGHLSVALPFHSHVFSPALGLLRPASGRPWGGRGRGSGARLPQTACASASTALGPPLHRWMRGDRAAGAPGLAFCEGHTEGLEFWRLLPCGPVSGLTRSAQTS